MSGKIKPIKDKFPESIKREFECRSVKYNLVVSPAFIEEAGGFTAYFPGVIEEVVEDALRKLMTEDNAFYSDEGAGIAFTLYQLQKEFAVYKHSYSYDQLKQALEILTKTNIEIESADKSVKLLFSPIDMLGLKGQSGETQMKLIDQAYQNRGQNGL